MGSNYFVTGTDTGVGKTVVSALLVAALDGAYWKPVQSGACEETDRSAVMRWAKLSPDRAFPECYCFDPPVSPHLAARMSGVQIDLKRICRAVPVVDCCLVVEGAGGVLVPLNEKETILDLIRQLNFPVIIAARSTLGTINHTLLTVRALAAASVEVRGVVMVGDENRENQRAIESYGKIPVIGRVPVLPSICRESLRRAFDSFFAKEYVD